MTRSPLIEAAERLSKAALVIGDTIERGEDPRWPECQELEAAAIHYRNTYRAAESGQEHEPCK